MIKQVAVCSALAAGLLAPSLAHASEPGRHVSLLGFDVCVGEVPDGTDCDAHIRPPPDATARDAQTMAVSFELLDRMVCVGELPANDACWLRIPHPDAAATTVAANDAGGSSNHDS